MKNRPFTYAVLVELSLLVVAAGLALVTNTAMVEQLEIDARIVVLGIVGTLPLRVMLLWLMRTSWPPVTEIRGIVEEFIEPMLGRMSVVQMLVLSIAAGVGEEFLFRGFLQVWLSGLLDPVAGIVIASLLFGTCHLITPAYGILAAVIGGYLGILMIYTGSIWPPVIAHALYDFIALILLFKLRDGKMKHSTS